MELTLRKISRSEAVTFSMGDLGEALGFFAFSMDDLAGDLLFLTLSLDISFRESRLATGALEWPLTFPEFCPSAARREMKPGTSESLAETFEMSVGVTSLPCAKILLNFGIVACFLITGSLDEVKESSSVFVLASESWGVVSDKLGQKGDVSYILS